MSDAAKFSVKGLHVPEAKQYVEGLKSAYAKIVEGGGAQRAGQWTMMKAIGFTLLDHLFENKVVIKDQPGNNVLMVEAPTGTGKTFGYLVPLMLAGRFYKKKVVVATAVISLQEQIALQDAAKVMKFLGHSFTYAMAKGRTNYLCSQKANTYLRSASEGKGQGAVAFERNAGGLAEFEAIKALVGTYKEGGWDGDVHSIRMENISGLSGKTLEKHWPKMTTAAAGCSGKKCPSYKSCAYYMQRDKWRKADLIITNHDMLLNDLMLGGGVILSKPDETLYAVDEAHNLASTASKTLSREVSLSKLVPLLSHALPLALADLADFMDVSKWRSISPETTAIYESTLRLMEVLNSQAEALQGAVAALEACVLLEKSKTSSKTGPFVCLNIPKDAPLRDKLADVTTPLTDASAALSAILGAACPVGPAEEGVITLQDMAMNAGDRESLDKITKMRSALRVLKEHMDTYSQALGGWQEDSPVVASEPPYMRVAEVFDGTKGPEMVLRYGPVWAGKELRQHVWSKVPFIVLTSGTMRTTNGFKLMRQTLGLDSLPGVVEAAVPSPFNFQKQGKIVHAMLPVSPKNPNDHMLAVAKMLEELMAKNPDVRGWLNLSASRKLMEDIHANLPEKLQALSKLQYSQPLSELIAEHRKSVASGQTSLLSGSSSLMEGLDLPGAQCSKVIIPKLFFPSPDSPETIVLENWMRQFGRSHFDEVAVPEAGSALVQAVGRGVRTSDDYAEIIIADNRLFETRFGARILAALPPFPRETWEPDFAAADREAQLEALAERDALSAEQVSLAAAGI